MESLLANFNPDKIDNFWKLYPSWKTPSVFHKLYLDDKSKNKDESSLLMWAIIHMFDKSECNAYRKLDSIEKVEVINDDILDDSKFDWKTYKEVVDVAKKLLMDENQRSLQTLIDYEDERRRVIEENRKNLNFEIMKLCDDAYKRSVDISKEKDRLIALIELKSEDGTNKGGKIESAREMGLF